MRIILRLMLWIPFLIPVAACTTPQHLNTADSGSAVSGSAWSDSEDDSDSDASSLSRSHDSKPSISKDSPDTPQTSDQIIQKAIGYCDNSQSCWKNGDTDSALKSLDRAYSLLLKIDQNDSPEVIRHKEALRFRISKRILEIYACRNNQSVGIQKAIPMEMNEHVKQEIAVLTEGEFFINAYRRSGRYRDVILKELRAAGMPDDLSWLPLIESGFRVDAFSKSRALGLWQFISSTGFRFGLKKDQHIDERMDPIKSTRAAIAYLKELHRIFGDWSTVLAAYNCGEGRVLDVIRTQNVNYLDNFWDLYEKLPYETARYYPRFIATLHMIRNPGQYGLTNLSLDPPLTFDTLTIDRQLSLKQIALAMDISPETLQDLNPELRQQVSPNYSYNLRVLKGMSHILASKLSSIPNAPPPATVQYASHKVRKGETLSFIARKYNASVASIMEVNHLKGKNSITVGKTLSIPVKNGSRSASTAISQGKKAAAKGKPSTHRVKKGESLYNIARKYGVSSQDLARCNRIKSDSIIVGQVLTIPANSACEPLLSHAGSGDGDAREQVREMLRLTRKSEALPERVTYVE